MVVLTRSGEHFFLRRPFPIFQADVAQLVEQSIRNRQVIGSSPIVGSTADAPAAFLSFF